MPPRPPPGSAPDEGLSRLQHFTVYIYIGPIPVWDLIGLIADSLRDSERGRN